MKDKGDQLVWYLMVTAISILILGGGAWATNINNKVSKIAALEVNIEYIKLDISEIKKMIADYIKKGE